MIDKSIFKEIERENRDNRHYNSTNNQLPKNQFMGFLTRERVGLSTDTTEAHQPLGTSKSQQQSNEVRKEREAIQNEKEERLVPYFDFDNSKETRWLLPISLNSFHFTSHCSVDVNGHLLLFGGTTNTSDDCNGNQTLLIQTSPLNSYNLYLIRPAGDIPQPRERHTACRIGKLVYIFGGYYRKNSVEIYYDTIYQFDSDTLIYKKLEPTGEIPEKRCGHSCAVVGTNIYIIGGRTKVQVGTGYSATYSVEYKNDVYCFDTVLREWKKCFTRGLPPIGRALASVVVVDHIIYIFGGANAQGQGGNSTGFCDFYKLDTLTMVWSEVEVKTGFPLPRFGHTLTRIGNNRLLLFGGQGAGRSIQTIHIYDLKTSEWVECNYLGNKFKGRWGHTASLHHDKFLIIVGGMSDGDQFENILVININKDIDYRTETERLALVPETPKVVSELDELKKTNKISLSLIGSAVESIAIEVSLLGEASLELDEECSEITKLLQEMKRTQLILQDRSKQLFNSNHNHNDNNNNNNT